MIINIIIMIIIGADHPKEDHIEVITLQEVLEVKYTEVEGKETLITNSHINIHNKITRIITGIQLLEDKSPTIPHKEDIITLQIITHNFTVEPVGDGEATSVEEAVVGIIIEAITISINIISILITIIQTNMVPHAVYVEVTITHPNTVIKVNTTLIILWNK